MWLFPRITVLLFLPPVNVLPELMGLPVILASQDGQDGGAAVPTQAMLPNNGLHSVLSVEKWKDIVINTELFK
jgi:hypothetical protein